MLVEDEIEGLNGLPVAFNRWLAGGSSTGPVDV
jgi:hypothetical protein